MFGLTPYNKRNNEIGSLFESFFNDSFFPSIIGNTGGMKVDIKENEKEYTVHVDIPGVNKEQINLDLRYDTLTISVENREELNEEKENYIRRERRYGSMARSFHVENVKEDAVKAKFENGVLTITLLKTEEAPKKSGRIEIE